MASILEELPHEGQQVLFAGRHGAVRLPDDRILLVSATGSSLAEEAVEPSDNIVGAPLQSAPSVRPSYLERAPFSTTLHGRPRAADAAMPVDTAPPDPWPWNPGPWSLPDPRWDEIGLLLWRQRFEPDDYPHQDPYTGGVIRVAQALRAALIEGVQSHALSYLLEFGDTEHPEVCYQLKQVVNGISDGAGMFELPVVAGDLQSNPDLGLHPKVALTAHGIVGRPAARSFEQDGELVVVVGRTANDISGSLLLASFGVAESFPPPIDLIAEQRVQSLVLEGLSQGILGCVRDCGRGGLLITLATCCAGGGRGVRCVSPENWRQLSKAAILFGEGQSRFVASLSDQRLSELRRLAQNFGVDLEPIGYVEGKAISFPGLIELPLVDLQ